MKWMWIDIDEPIVDEIRHELYVGGRQLLVGEATFSVIRWEVGQSELIQELIK